MIVAVAATLLAVVLGARQIAAAFAVFAGSFVAATVVYEWVRGVRGRVRSTRKNPLAAFVGLIGANRPRYGGYVVHLGIAIMAIGIAWSSLFVSSKDITMKPGGTTTVGGYTVTFNSLQDYATARRQGVKVQVSVSKGGSVGSELTALKFYDPRQQVSADQRQWVTEVAIKSTPKEDVYVILVNWDSSQNTAFKILVNPLVMWIWIGGGVLVLGGLIAYWPERASAKAVSTRTQGSRQ